MVSELNKEIDVAVVTIVAAGRRAEQNGQPDILLGAQRPRQLINVLVDDPEAAAQNPCSALSRSRYCWARERTSTFAAVSRRTPPLP